MIIKCLNRSLIIFSLVVAHFLGIQRAFGIDNDNQIWTLLTATGNIPGTNDLRFYIEGQPRIGDNASRMERSLMRGAIGYRFADGWTGWMGYGWTPTYIDSHYSEDFNNESRIWEQLTYDDSRGPTFVINHRLRLEQRLIQHQPETSHRIRYLLKGSIPLADYHSTTAGLTGYNEIFLNINNSTPGAERGYDRDRIFIGPYIKSGPVRYELGFLGEYSTRRDKIDRMLYAAVFSLAFAF